jgi:hypothetical protein
MQIRISDENKKRLQRLRELNIKANPEMQISDTSVVNMHLACGLDRSIKHLTKTK